MITPNDETNISTIFALKVNAKIEGVNSSAYSKLFSKEKNVMFADLRSRPMATATDK